MYRKFNLKNQNDKKNSLSWSWPIPRQKWYTFFCLF